MNEESKFKELVKEIHRVNQGWHCYETVNRFLDTKNKYLQSNYLKKKNSLQDQLIQEYPDMLIIFPVDESGFQSIGIKKEYHFEHYQDACHIKSIIKES